MRVLQKLKDINDRLISGLESEFGIGIPDDWKNFFRALAADLAGAVWLIYLALGVLQKNVAPDTADPESQGGTLERFGRIKLGRNPFPAKAGKYQVAVTGDVGAIIKASTTFKSNDDSLNPGMLFVLDDDFSLTATSDYITIRALTPGIGAKLNISDRLTATAPILFVDKGALVSAELEEPRAAEDIEAYRAAVLYSYRMEAQGGAGTDYRIWAQDAQGVKQVYPYAASGVSCEVDLFVEATVTDSIDGKGTPSGALLDDVKDVIEFSPDITLPLYDRGRRPMTVIVNYLPISPLPVIIIIDSFVGVDAATQTVILNTLKGLIDSIRPFIASADILENKNDILDVYRISAAILDQKKTAVFANISMTVNGVSLESKTFTMGDIPYLDSIVYV